MEQTIQITFHNMRHSDAVEARIRSRVAKLARYCDCITGCRVVVEVPHRHHRAGNSVHVRIEIAVPGQTLVANREPDARDASTDVDVALRDAFDAMRRQLEDYERRRRGQVKAHLTLPVEPEPQTDTLQAAGEHRTDG